MEKERKVLLIVQPTARPQSASTIPSSKSISSRFKSSIQTNCKQYNSCKNHKNNDTLINLSTFQQNYRPLSAYSIRMSSVGSTKHNTAKMKKKKASVSIHPVGTECDENSHSSQPSYTTTKFTLNDQKFNLPNLDSHDIYPYFNSPNKNIIPPPNENEVSSVSLTIKDATKDSSVYKAKMERFEVEKQFNLLKNRLSKLKSEQNKAYKKIEDTRKRAICIASVKARKKIIPQHIIKKYEEKQELDNKKTMIMQQEKEHKQKREENIASIQKEKVAQAFQVKDIKRKNNYYIQMQRDKDLQKKVDIRQKVQQEEARIKQLRKSRQHELEKLQHLRNIQKVMSEKGQKNQILNQISQMEAEEEALILQLKATQILQANVNEALRCNMDS